MANPPKARKKRWLTVAAVRERYGGVSHMWVERRIESDPTFPRFTKLGRLRFFDEAELEAWERDCARNSGKRTARSAVRGDE